MGWLAGSPLMMPGSVMGVHQAGMLAGLQGPRWPHSGNTPMSGSWCRLLAGVLRLSCLTGRRRPDQLPYVVVPGRHSNKNVWRQKLQSLLRPSLGEHCFYCILMVKANHMSIPDSTGGESGSTSKEYTYWDGRNLWPYHHDEEHRFWNQTPPEFISRSGTPSLTEEHRASSFTSVHLSPVFCKMGTPMATISQDPRQD